MKAKIAQYYQSTVVRHYTRVVAFAIFGALVGATLVALILGFERSGVYITQTDNLSGEVAATEISLDASFPVRLQIPKIGIDAAFEDPLGVDENREIEVPEAYETVGWYKYGPTPGELGPAVVLGHVDSYEGPAVLYDLGRLNEGDPIYIEREDGMTATFTVEKIGRYDQQEFPTDDVYGDLPYAGLRLITCTGTYKHDELRYTHNLIVFAKLTE